MLWKKGSISGLLKTFGPILVFYTKNKFDSKPQKPIIALSNFPHSARFRGQIAKVVLFSNECNNLLHAIFDKTMSTITTYKKWSEFFRNNKKQVGNWWHSLAIVCNKLWKFLVQGIPAFRGFTIRDPRYFVILFWASFHDLKETRKETKKKK